MVHSLLDVMLGTPMATLLPQLRVPAEVVDAILHQRGPCAAALRLAQACEESNPALIAALCAESNIDITALGNALAAAQRWVHEVTQQAQS
jgi:c-di-GMP phosphodiesterase